VDLAQKNFLPAINKFPETQQHKMPVMKVIRNGKVEPMAEI
jgi:hypothetical protein